ncbi:hypothetical protein LC613_37680 [Nostoc sphaeroides CHAB 2801]|uniref:hypothetical protein n=1 Tax=Nostoc sphaeroides TaxID=446679 RepID=UPI001E30DB34|nr:hypothetical protein [Nostoc sphaeroides]MCC5633228.1 hypothetical protein [Nostoc sphaeroides CHAB 2801]
MAPLKRFLPQRNRYPYPVTPRLYDVAPLKQILGFAISDRISKLHCVFMTWLH